MNMQLNYRDALVLLDLCRQRIAHLEKRDKVRRLLGHPEMGVKRIEALTGLGDCLLAIVLSGDDRKTAAYPDPPARTVDEMVASLQAITEEGA